MIAKKKRRKTKRRVYSSYPEPWRERMGHIENIVNIIQKQVEVKIAWSHEPYDLVCLTELDGSLVETRKRRDALKAIIKAFLGDVDGIEIIRYEKSFGWLLRLNVKGTPPKKFKRVKF